MITKDEAAAIAYHAIHEQIGVYTAYEDKLRYVIDVIDIIKVMADTEYKKYIDSQQKMESKAVG